MTPLPLQGRGAIVAGGGGGIGQAVCARLLESGAQVVSIDRDDCRPPNGAGAVVCDLTDSAEVAAAVAAAHHRTGRIDIVVHCAGITRDGPLVRMSDDDWRAVMAANLDSAFYLLRSTGPLLRATGAGAVVLVSSINGERGKAGQANYAASKAGLIALGRTTAREWGRHHVRVNVVSPGWTETPMTAGLPDQLRARALADTALGRLGRPDEVAGAVLFLCSDESRHITGQVLRVDGGQLIG
ncbi:MAG TPA: SDR family oxidoreductase [Vicinamibacterales bacterium]|nr:SDR family oxidoreductase [Vicinamibacterales bacterium]